MRWRWWIGSCGVLCAAMLWWWTGRVVARDPWAMRQIVDRHGAVLAEAPAHAAGLRYARRLSQLSPHLIDAVLAQEDQQFWWHPGMNPYGMARAVVANLRAGAVRQGGSTISQQLAKLYVQAWRGAPVPRTVAWKLAELAVALRLEWRWSKTEILEQYLNSVYVGHRLYGMEAAALAYWGKSAQDLRVDEARALATHIQRPNQARALQQTLGVRMLAPHLLTMLPAVASAPTTATTLDAAAQQRAVAAVTRGVQALREKAPAVQAAAVVVDTASGELRALVGSDNFLDDAHQGAVNYATALRQPGSALKPFTYYTALRYGYQAGTVLADEPYQFLRAGGGSYQPQNFDRQFRGPVSLREALGNSLNVPAVVMLSELGVNSLLTTLREFGVTSLTDSPSHYGLSLTLGSGAVSLLELTHAYAHLAQRAAGSDAAAHTITTILSDSDARMRQFGDAVLMQLDAQPVAVKTGTSNGARDAWALGYTPRYTVGVWVGNPDNAPMPGLTGAKAAVPIWHDIMQTLHEGLPIVAFESPVYDPFKRVAAAGGLPMNASSAPQALAEFADATRAMPIMGGAGDRTRLQLESRARTIPTSLRLIAPAHGARYQMDARLPSAQQQVRLEVRVPADVATTAPITWRVDDIVVAETPYAQPRIFVPLTPGVHRVTAQVENKTTRAVEYWVDP